MPSPLRWDGGHIVVGVLVKHGANVELQPSDMESIWTRQQHRLCPTLRFFSFCSGIELIPWQWTTQESRPYTDMRATEHPRK